MRGHEQYAELLGALDERDEDLIAVLEETAVFDVTGADYLPYPDDLDAREELLKEAGKSGLTALDIPKWAMVPFTQPYSFAPNDAFRTRRLESAYGTKLPIAVQKTVVFYRHGPSGN